MLCPSAPAFVSNSVSSVALGRIVDLGFLHPLKGSGTGADQRFEVRRILKAFVDAQWLADLDARLESYRVTETVAEGDRDA